MKMKVNKLVLTAIVPLLLSICSCSNLFEQFTSEMQTETRLVSFGVATINGKDYSDSRTIYPNDNYTIASLTNLILTTSKLDGEAYAQLAQNTYSTYADF